MKVLLLTTHLDIGGIGIYTVWLAEGLVKRGHGVWVASGGGRLVSELQARGIPHLDVNIRTKCDISPRVFWTVVRLQKVIKKEGIELIHAQTRVAQVAAHLLAKLADVPYLSTCHGFFKPRWGRRVFPCWGDAVVAISEPVREHLVNDFKVSKQKVSLIPNGIDLDRISGLPSGAEKDNLRRRYGLGADSQVIGIIGRLSPVKGHRYLLLALAELISTKPKIHCLIVGDGDLRAKLIKLAKTLNIVDHISFLEATPKTQLPLAVMGCFVLPSLQEGLGLAILEAMAMGLPVVASDVGGIYTLIKDGQNGFLVPPADPSALAKAIGKLLDDEGLAKRMGQAGQRMVQRKFSLDKMVRQIEGVYKDIVTGPGARR